MQFYNSIISGPGICDLTKFLTSDQTQITHSYFDTLDCAALPSNITCGPGILTGIDPLFVNPDSGDYRLQPCSPLINAGSNAYVLDSTDLDGLPRIRGGTVDIGAYEAQGPSLAAAPNHPLLPRRRFRRCGSQRAGRLPAAAVQLAVGR